MRPTPEAFAIVWEFPIVTRLPPHRAFGGALAATACAGNVSSRTHFAPLAGLCCEFGRRTYSMRENPATRPLLRGANLDGSQPPLPIRAMVAPVTPLQQNCTIVWCAKTLKAAVIDPGGEVPRLLEALSGQGLTLEKIWITHADLIAAITGKLWPLGDDVRFVPGHGPMSSFGQERRTNPFVADAVLSHS